MGVKATLLGAKRTIIRKIHTKLSPGRGNEVRMSVANVRTEIRDWEREWKSLLCGRIGRMRRRERICLSGQEGEDKPPPAAGRRKMYGTLFSTYFLSSNNFPFSQIDAKAAAKGFS